MEGSSLLENKFPPEPGNVCRHCRSGAPEPGYAMALCAGCRQALARRPFPPWIRLTALAILGVLVFAFIRSVGSFQAGVAFERGKRAERARHYRTAANYYQKVVDRFPDSVEPTARLGITRIRAGQVAEGARALLKLRGKKIPKALADEINKLLENLPGEQDSNDSE